jgi:hypothetical protein
MSGNGLKQTAVVGIPAAVSGSFWPDLFLCSPVGQVGTADSILARPAFQIFEPNNVGFLCNSTVKPVKQNAFDLDRKIALRSDQYDCSAVDPFNAHCAAVVGQAATLH